MELEACFPFQTPQLLIANYLNHTMSYREQRSFIEKMRSLGYPALVSVDSFRTNNFPLVADILHWLCKKYQHFSLIPRSYDPETPISKEVSSEKDRVTFIKEIAIFLAQKANIKLSTRKLYMADGNAVQELLKVASVLYNANKADEDVEEESNTLPMGTTRRF